jgi:hypothetical protein
VRFLIGVTSAPRSARASSWPHQWASFDSLLQSLAAIVGCSDFVVANMVQGKLDRVVVEVDILVVRQGAERCAPAVGPVPVSKAERAPVKLGHGFHADVGHIVLVIESATRTGNPCRR